MILFKEKKYSNYIDILYMLVRENKKIDTNYFPYSYLFYCRAALENKFKRKFKLKEVKELIKDMPKALTPLKHNEETIVVHANEFL